MKTARALLSIFLIGLAALPAVAATDMFWEKERLERTVSDRIQAAVKPLVQEGSFGVLVNATLSRARGPVAVSRTESIDLGKLGGSVDVGTLQVEQPDDSERDLGGRILAIDAKLTVPEKLDAKRVETIRQTAEDILSGFGKFKTDVSVTKNAAFDVAVADDSHKTAGAPEAQPSWPLPVAILLGAALFAAIASWIANKLLALESRKVDAIEARSTVQERALRSEKEEAASSHSFEPFTAGPGLLRFQALAERDAAKAADLVRHWVALESEDALEALAYIGRYSNLDQLDKTLSFLEDAQKDQWRAAVQSDRDDTPAAERFLRSRAMDSVSNESQGSKDLHALLFDLTSAECAEVASRSPRDGALLLNALPALQVSRMLSLLPSETVAELARQSMTLDPASMKAVANDIRRSVLAKRQQSALIKVPFAQKTPELVRELDFEREKALFDSLIEAQQWETVRKTARQVFPSQLMSRLPAELLKQTLVQLPVSERAELILSVPRDLQQTLLNAFGTTGKLRELMDLQIAQMRADGHTVSRIEKQKSSYQRRLGSRVRQHLAASEANRDAAELVIEAWLSESEKGRHARAA